MTAQTLATLAAWSAVAAIACMLLGALVLARATRLPLWTTTILVILFARGATSMLYAVGIGVGAASTADMALATIGALGAIHASRRSGSAAGPMHRAVPLPSLIVTPKYEDADAA